MLRQRLIQTGAIDKDDAAVQSQNQLRPSTSPHNSDSNHAASPASVQRRRPSHRVAPLIPRPPSSGPSTSTDVSNGATQAGQSMSQQPSCIEQSVQGPISIAPRPVLSSKDSFDQETSRFAAPPPLSTPNQSVLSSIPNSQNPLTNNQLLSRGVCIFTMTPSQLRDQGLSVGNYIGSFKVGKDGEDLVERVAQFVASQARSGSQGGGPVKVVRLIKVISFLFTIRHLAGFLFFYVFLFLLRQNF